MAHIADMCACVPTSGSVQCSLPAQGRGEWSSGGGFGRQRESLPTFKYACGVARNVKLVLAVMVVDGYRAHVQVIRLVSARAAVVHNVVGSC